MSLALVMLGAGGHARVLLSALRTDPRLASATLEGYVAPTRAELAPHTADGPVPYLGDDASLARLDPQHVSLLNAIGSVGNCELRAHLYHTGKSASFAFVSVVHATAIIDASAELGEGVQVMAGALIQTNACIGHNTIVNTGAIIDHDCTVGASCHVATGAVLCGAVQVGNKCHIGSGATIIQGIRIGEGVTIAAGAVVVDNLPDHVLAVGVPARWRPL